MVDILGFSDLSRRISPQRIFEQIFEPLVQVRRNAAAVAAALAGRREEVFTLAFSDTILVYRPQRSDFRIPVDLPPHACIKLVGAAVADIIQKGLRRERPILFRGAKRTSDAALRSETGLAPGASLMVYIACDASPRSFTFPAWRWIGGAAPTTIAANKVAILELFATGTTDAQTLARYWVES